MPGLGDVVVPQQDYDQYQDQQATRSMADWADGVSQADAMHAWAGGVAQADHDAQTQAAATRAATQAATRTYDQATDGLDDMTAWADQVSARDQPPAQPSSGSVDVVGTDWRAYAAQAAQRAGIDPALFQRQIQQESGFDPNARSGAGAQGIAQIVPSAHPGVNPLDPKASLDYAANWMRQLTDRYGGDARKALAAYNAGPGAVDTYGGVPPFEETQRYVRTIYDEGGQASPLGPPVTPGTDSATLGRTRPPGRVEALGQFEQGLPAEDAYSICGPVAALAFAQANGRNPDLGEARRLAAQVGWTATGGMNGVANEQALLTRMGVKSNLDTNPDFGRIAQDAASGNPVIISTPVHYYYANNYDPATGKIFVGKTGTSRKGGGSWMTPQEIATLDGGINGALFVDNPQSPTPSVGADPMAAGEGDRPASEFETSPPEEIPRRLGPQLDQPITPGDVGQPEQPAMRPDLARVSRGQPGLTDVLAATDVPNRVGFAAAHALLTGRDPAQAILDTAREGGEQPSGETLLADAGMPAGEARRVAGQYLDAGLDWRNVVPGLAAGGKGAVARTLVAEPVGQIAGQEAGGAIGQRIGGESGRAVGTEIGGLVGGGLAGHHLQRVAEDPRTQRLGIVPVGVARAQRGPIEIPQDVGFRRAVAATPGADLTPEGVRVDLTRWQKDDQGMKAVAGGGVYYLPTGLAEDVTHYRRDALSPTGGPSAIQGTTLFRRPAIAPGAKVSGDAMENAYAALAGRRAWDQLWDDATSLSHLWDSLPPDRQRRSVEGLLARHKGDPADAEAIMQAADRFGYVSEEHLAQSVAAARLRGAGYDSVLGFGGHDGKTLTEVVDLRESHYPTLEGGFRQRREFGPSAVMGGSAGGASRSAEDLQRMIDQREAQSPLLDPLAHYRGVVDPGPAAPEFVGRVEQATPFGPADYYREPVAPGAPAGPLGAGTDVRVPASARQATLPGAADVPAGTRQVDLRGKPIPPPPGAAGPSLYDRFQTVRFAGMLSSTATQLLNNSANAVNTFADVGVKALSVPLDVAASRATGGERTRYWAEVAPQAKALMAGLLTGAQKIPHILATGVDPETAGALDLPRGGLRSGSRAVDTAVELPLRALSAADAMWRGAAYAGHAAALATRQAVKEGLTGADRAARVDHILSNLHEFKAIGEDASKLAARAVFQEHRPELDPLIHALKGTKFRYVTDVVLPFIRTPANVAAQGIGMTPVGVLGAWKAARAGQRGEAIDRAVRAGVGTAALGYGLSLAAGGYLTGATPDDAVERSTLPDGWKPYSLRIPRGDGAVYVPLQLLGPVAMPLGIAGALGDLYKRGQAGADPQKLAYRSVSVLGKYVGDQAFLQGLAALPNMIDEPERYLDRFLEGYASSLMPASAFQKQIDQFLGRAPRDPKGALEGFLAASPLTSQSVDARLTPLGDERQAVSGPAAFVAGTRISAERDDPTLATLRAAGAGIPAPPKDIHGMPLTEDEQRRFQQVAGERIREVVAALGDAGLEDLDPAVRERIYRKAVEAARGRARGEVLAGIGEDAVAERLAGHRAP